MADARDIVPRWHTSFARLSEKTRVFYVGPHVISLRHVCDAKPGAAERVYPITMQAPSMHHEGIEYCDYCDVLYVQSVPK